MARLLTTGFETFRVNTSVATTAEGEKTYFIGPAAIDSASPRGGAAYLYCSDGGSRYMLFENGSVLPVNRDYWFRAALRRNGTISAPFARTIAVYAASSAVICSVVMFGTNIAIRDSTDAEPAGSVRYTGTVANTWYLVEMHMRVNSAGAGQLGMWVDGVEVSPDVSASINNAGFDRVGFGVTATTGTIIGVDDVAINDDQGSDQNGRPGLGKVGLLLPTALGAGGRGNWTDGGGGTTNLHNAVDNRPPTGTAAGSAGTQIKTPSSGPDNPIEFDLAAYNTLVPATHTIVLVQPLWRTGVSSTLGGPGTGRVFSNPDSGADNIVGFGPSGVVAATDPAGWQTKKGAYVHFPTVDQSVGPKLRLTDTQTDPYTYSCDLMGLLVEYRPTVTTVHSGAATVSAQTSLTANGCLVSRGASALGAETTLTASGLKQLTASVIPLTAATTLLAAGLRQAKGVAGLTAQSNLLAIGRKLAIAQAAWSANANLTITGRKILSAASAFAAVSNIAADADVQQVVLGEAEFSANTILLMDAYFIRMADISLLAQSNLEVTAPIKYEDPTVVSGRISGQARTGYLEQGQTGTFGER